MIRLDNVSKIFGTGVAGLSEINLLIDKGEFVFLVGHTGSGKTTLLRLIVRDTLPTSGTIIVSDFDVVKLPANKIPHLRKKVGVVFQDLKLLMDRTILENILLPMQVAGIVINEGTKRAEELLQMVGLSEHKEKFPIQLSGGELQRVAIARALALSPEILLADEPTGNLDPQTAKEIVDLLAKINEMGTTIIMATHNLDIVGKMGKRVVGLEKGKLVKDEKKGHSAKKDKEDDLEVSKEIQEKHHSKDSKEAKVSKDAKDKTLESVILSDSEGSQSKDDESGLDSSASPQNDNIDIEEKSEHHKKETKKLSDLLTRARQSLHKHNKEDLEVSKHAKESKEEKDGMPFGFSKEEDVAQIEETGDDKKEDSSNIEETSSEGKDKKEK